MNVQGRRDVRGAIRATPEDILRDAIARYRALRDQEEWRARAAAPAKTAAPRKAGDEARRAQFAEGLARAEFGRFYRKEPRR